LESRGLFACGEAIEVLQSDAPVGIYSANVSRRWLYQFTEGLVIRCGKSGLRGRHCGLEVLDIADVLHNRVTEAVSDIFSC
jgi:hypothetical protein